MTENQDPPPEFITTLIASGDQVRAVYDEALNKLAGNAAQLLKRGVDPIGVIAIIANRLNNMENMTRSQLASLTATAIMRIVAHNKGTRWP